MNELVVSLCLLVTAVLYFISHRYTYWRQRKVPSLPAVFPLGSLYSVKSFNLVEKLHEIYSEFKGIHPVAGMYLFLKPVLVALDFEVIRGILIKDFSVFTDRMQFVNGDRQPLSDHLFSMRGSKWRSMRSKLSPTFTSGKMKFMFPTIVEVAEEFGSTMRSMLEYSNVVEIRELLARYTTDVIGSCVFGIKCNSLRDPKAEFFYYGRRVMEKPKKSTLLRLFLVSHREITEKIGLTLHDQESLDFFLRSITDTVATREANNIQRNDFLNQLIELKNQTGPDGLGGWTIEEIAAQAFVFFVAGFETSASNMSFGLFEMAKQPEVQDKAREEIKTVLAKHNNQLTYEAMSEMTYLTQCINETLRKYPALAYLSRTANENYPVPGTKLIIDKGTHVLIPVSAIHYDPEIYPNPTIYDPDRFHPNNAKTRDAMAFLPFGDGPRNCIGLRFGFMQVRVGLITLLKSFRFSVTSDTPEEILLNSKTFVTMPQDGLWLKVEAI